MAHVNSRVQKHRDALRMAGLRPVQASFKRLGKTFSELKKYRDLSIGLLAFWIYANGIGEFLGVFGVAKDTIYTWVTSKGMPGHKVGRFWKFKKEDVDTWVREGGAAASSDDFDDKEPRNA